ncbi:MAG: TIGR04086 family membrane protein [Anaerostipes sp.]|nr:TIGR04086 family membrane protein [Anaerostipes sp.]MDD3745589.1 TIGR04086 family membrane protein [Anaerostipes sp.]
MKQKHIGITIIETLTLSYLLTGILLCTLALLMYRTDINQSAANLGVTLIYIIASLLCGIFVGKKMKHRKFLWGFLLGLLYFLILFCISCLLKQDAQLITKERITTMFLCIGGGTLGGMLS